MQVKAANSQNRLEHVEREKQQLIIQLKQGMNEVAQAEKSLSWLDEVVGAQDFVEKLASAFVEFEQLGLKKLPTRETLEFLLSNLPLSEKPWAILRLM